MIIMKILYFKKYFYEQFFYLDIYFNRKLEDTSNFEDYPDSDKSVTAIDYQSDPFIEW
jgi:hypothetical protein